jgi:hypothetical protein
VRVLPLLGHEELDGSRVGGVPGLSGEPAQALAVSGLAELEGSMERTSAWRSDRSTKRAA